MFNFLLALLLMSSSPATEAAVTGYPQPIQLDELLIYLPSDAAQRQYPLVICFGGSMWATPQFLYQQTPAPYFEQAILVYSPCYVKGGKGLRKVEQRLWRFLADKNIDACHVSLCGFSSGGPDAMIASAPQQYQCIALIDPSPKADGKVTHSSNMILSFRRNNWIYSDYYGEVVNFKPFNELSAAIKGAGGTVEETDISHKAYFHYFLEKFEEEILGGAGSR